MAAHSSQSALVEFVGLASLPDEWRFYRDWNQALRKHFFAGRFQGRPVYLDLDERNIELVRASVLPDVVDAQSHLINAVRATLITSGVNVNPFRAHVKNGVDWQQAHYQGEPPFVALLGLFSLVAETMVRDPDFAANNYYGRLSKLLALPDYMREALVKGYGQTADALWPMLNTWLNEWNGVLGYPTAKALDHRRYVSVAISQALVREHDRNLLHRMFWDLQLEAGQKVREMEMEAALAHWISSNNHQATYIATLFGRGGEIRSHVVEIACSELESWNGKAERSGAAQVAGRLAVIGQLRKHPLPRLELYLAAQATEKLVGDISVLLADGSDGAARVAVGDVVGGLRLEPIEGTEIVALEPWPEIRSGDALLARFEFDAPECPVKRFVRVGSPLCILSYRERDNFFKEIAQAPLMEPLLVLANEPVVNKVESHLNRVARPGYRKLGTRELAGLPTQWTAFVGVQILQSIETPGLESLAPLSRVALVLSGGMRVGQETWHVDAPPELMFVDTDSTEPARVRISQRFSFGKKIGELSRYGGQGAAIVDLGELSLSDGDYDASAGGDGHVGTTRFRLRSSNSARPISICITDELVYAVSAGEPIGMLSASRKSEVGDIEDAAEATYVSGAVLQRELFIGVLVPQGAMPRDRLALTSQAEVPPERESIADTKTTPDQSCVQRSYHVWVYPYLDPKERKPPKMRVTCRGCGTTLFVLRTAGRPRRKAANAAAPQNPARAKVALPELPAMTSNGNQPDFDVMFDSLNYIRGGSFIQFSSLFRSLDDSPWAAQEYARELAALCHIDIRLDTKSFRPQSWMTAPTAIVEIAEDEARLSGWRSRRLLELLAERVDKLGG